MDGRVAERPQPLDLLSRAGLFSLALITLLVLGSLAALLFHGRLDWSFTAYFWRITGFSFMQAFLSALLSLLLGMGFALTMLNRAWLQRFVPLLLAVALIVPPVVAARGVLSVWGREGWFGFDIFGLQGILLAHVFFNAPLAARVLYGTLCTIPAGDWKQAAQLGLSPLRRLLILCLPAMTGALWGLFGLIFLLCFTSFALVLLLGGGPATNTLEVAIYEAVRLDHNLGRAGLLGLLQLLICGVVLLLSGGRLRFDGAVEAKHFAGLFPRSALWSLAGWGLILTMVLLVAAPLIAVIGAGLAGINDALEVPQILRALLISLVVALSSGTLASFSGLVIAEAGHRSVRAARLIHTLGMIYLALPAITFGTGLFLLLRPFSGLEILGPLLVVLANSLLALPFVLRILAPARASITGHDDRLCAHLGLGLGARWRFTIWPTLRRPFAFAFALAAALSFGDLSVIALFGSADFVTLPWLMSQLSGSYRSAAADGVALILLLSALLLFAALERGIGGGRHA